MSAPFIPHHLPLKKLRRAHFQKELKRAQHALLRFDALLHCHPSPTLLSTLITQEVKAALEAQRLKKNEKRPLVHYCKALKKGMRIIKTNPINKSLLCTLHAQVKYGCKNANAGKYRTKQNWIGAAQCTREEADFLPPTVKQMHRSMQNLFIYGNQKSKEPLIQIAIFMAQLLIIHPFMDGNGRLARIITTLLIYKKKLLSYPLLFLSPYFQIHRRAYIRKLYEITEKNKWEEWILFFLKGVREAANKSYRMALKIKKP
jgi:Fic family protein